MLRLSFQKIKHFSNIFFENFSGLDSQAEIELHNSVVNSCLELKSFIPERHQDYCLENIVLPKLCSYHTNLDKSLRQYFYVKKSLKKILFNESISDFIAKMVIDTKDKNLHNSMRDKQFEEFSGSNPNNDIPNNESAELIFFASQPAHINILDSYFKHSKLTNYQLLLPKRLKKTLLKHESYGSNCIFLEDFFEERDHLLFENSQKEFLDILLKKEKELQKIFQFKGKGFFNAQKPGIENTFKFLFPQSLLYATAFRRILRLKKTKKVIGVRPRRIYDRAMFQTAKSLGIETSLIFHSTIGTSQRELWTSGIYNNIDNIFGWGKTHRELMKRDNFSDKANFLEVGSPLFNMPPKERELSNKTPKIIYASTKNDKNIILALIKIKKLFDNLSITIKIHPGEGIPNHVNGEVFSIEPGNFPIENILEGFDVFITSYSGSHIAAMSLGLPVLFAPFYFQFPQDLDTLYGINKKSMFHSYAKNPKELINILEKVLNNKRYRDTLIAEQKKYLSNLLANHTDKQSVKLIDNRLLS